MRSPCLLVGLLGLVACVSSRAIRPRDTFAPPGPLDQRSPCPALNTLANHGILDRSGQDWKAEDVVNALEDVFNVDQNLGKGLAYGAVFLTGDILTSTFSLGALSGATDVSGLSTHNKIEHDASLTRQDAAMGNNHDLDPDLYNQLKSVAKGKPVTSDVLSLHRLNRYNYSQANNPSFTFGPQQWFVAYAESAAALLGFGGDSRAISLETLDSFFLNERLPDSFQKASAKVDIASVNALVFEIYNKNPIQVQGLPPPKTIQDVNCFFIRSFGNRLLKFLSSKTGIPIPNC